MSLIILISANPVGLNANGNLNAFPLMNRDPNTMPHLASYNRMCINTIYTYMVITNSIPFSPFIGPN